MLQIGWCSVCLPSPLYFPHPKLKICIWKPDAKFCLIFWMYLHETRAFGRCFLAGKQLTNVEKFQFSHASWVIIKRVSASRGFLKTLEHLTPSNLLRDPLSAACAGAAGWALGGGSPGREAGKRCRPFAQQRARGSVAARGPGTQQEPGTQLEDLRLWHA